MTLLSLYILGRRFPLEIVYKEADCPALGRDHLSPLLLLSQSVSACPLSSLSDISWRQASRLEGILNNLVVHLQSV